MTAERSEPPESMREQKRGSTNMKQCGWCTYASGTHRFDYCIDGSCSLQKAYGPERNVAWDTKCRFLAASQADIQAIIKSHERQIEQSESTIKREKEYLFILTDLAFLAPERPCLPDDRECKHFNVGKPVRVWYHDQWRTGEVRMGYRHQDGCVSYRLDGIGPQDGNDQTFPYQGGFWGSGMCIPHVMLESEFQFFLANPQDYMTWCERAYSKDFNGKRLTPAALP